MPVYLAYDHTPAAQKATPFVVLNLQACQTEAPVFRSEQETVPFSATVTVTLLMPIETHAAELSGTFTAEILPVLIQQQNLQTVQLSAPKTDRLLNRQTITASHKLEEDSKLFGENMERVTFHPNYSYAQFVGTYKPIQGENPTDIKYEYVPGPFMRTYVNALNNPEKKFLLLIEEINRANVAAVFGDVFQLLDRKNGVSEYPIATSEDIKKHLLENLDCLKDKDINELSDEEKKMCLEMKIPENMYIWATMNSADQGVFPMDTAFKRRWEFEYISVNEPEQVAKIEKYVIPMCANTEQGYYVNWNDLRTRINSILIDNCKVNEDKLLGPFFISKNMLDDIKANKDEKDRVLATDEEIRSDEDNNILAEVHKKEISYMKAFESKVIMYLFEDVMKMRAEKIFIDYAQKKGKMIFSEICKAFEEDGEHIFGIADIGHLRNR